MALQLISHGETTRTYRNQSIPHILFVEQTDKFTIDDKVFPDTIFLKGVILNQMSNNWMELLEKAGIIKNPIIACNASSLIKLGLDNEELFGRTTAVQEYIPIPLECIVRGYYIEESESWEPYRKNCNMYGNVLPRGLKDSEQLPIPIYTPSTKGNLNEPDINIPFADTIGVIKKFLVENFDFDPNDQRTLYDVAFSTANAIRNVSMNAYSYARNYAEHKGIIIADAKLEFGIVYDKDLGTRKLVIASDAFTPDTCRFWNSNKYKVGRPQQSYDKHLIKRYASRSLKWKSSSETPPVLPPDILEKASQTYWDIYERLFGSNFVEVTSNLSWEWKMAQEDILI